MHEAMRITVVTPIPTPYRDPFWEVVSREEGIELSVVYCSAGREDRPWDSEEEFGYARLFPRGINLAARAGWGASCAWNPQIASLLRELEPDAVLVGGYNHLTILAAVRKCRQRNIPWYLMSESWRRSSSPVGRVKQVWLQRWLRTASGGLPTGQLAAAQLEAYGLQRQRQCLVPNIPDIERLRREAVQAMQRRSEICQELRIDPSERVVLLAARMIDKKRPLEVVEAFAQLDTPGGTLLAPRQEPRPATGQRTRLVMLGDGPLLPAARARAEHLGCADRIRFEGFVAPRTVHRWMQIADLFVQPSSETWGVAPIEALASGCGLLLARATGCQADILQSDRDGLAVEQATPAALAAAMRQLLARRGKAQGHLPPPNAWLENNSYIAVAGRLLEFLRRTTVEREQPIVTCS
jgi:glycosyltransferase involved in cell wall biosynthesis